MTACTIVTGQQIIDRIRELIAGGDDAGAIAYWDEIRPSVWGSLDAREFGVITGLMSSATKAVLYAENEALEAQTRAESGTASSTTSS